METQFNPFEGIYFHPAVEKYSATVGKRIIGVFDSLDGAVAARDRCISYHATKHRMSHATAHSFREMRHHG